MLSPLERKSDDEKVRRTVCIRMRSDRERHARAGLLHACTWLGGARIRGMREWYFRFEYANVEKNGDEWNKNVISPQLLLSTFKKKRKKKETIFCMYDRCCNRCWVISIELYRWNWISGNYLVSKIWTIEIRYRRYRVRSCHRHHYHPCHRSHCHSHCRHLRRHRNSFSSRCLSFRNYHRK